MNINEEILVIFREFRIKEADGICYLISLFYGYDPSYIPEELKQRVNATGIVKEENGSLTWTIPIFDKQQTAFEWVKTEYTPLFKRANPIRAGKVRESTARMKKIFADNPDIRKEEILGATEMYLGNTDSKYVMFPHYFLFKGTGADKTYNILDWVDKYRLSQENNANRTSDRRKLL